MSWAFWIDRGGTFTDAIGRGPAGELRVDKRLSSDRAPLECVRAILGLEPDAPIPPCELRMGTTLGTNALLERRGARVALVTSRGLGDLLEIGTQQRPELFALHIEKPPVIYAAVVELDCRVGADGAILAPLDPQELRAKLGALERVDALAVVLPHAYAFPEQEREIGRIARELGFAEVSLSHEVDRELGLLARGDTTCVDAYLTPLLGRYLAGLRRELPGSTLRVMSSSGGLLRADRFRGRDALLSGPAGGVVAVAEVARAAGLSRAIGFDMGGTSTDVCRWDGRFDRRYESELAGVRVRAPMMAIHTVAAGGGSLCRYEGGRLTVGPESAGARPGPLAYGDPAARELTLTDVDLALGRLQADRFPIPLDASRVAPALEALAARVSSDGAPMSADEVAAGLFEIASAHMADAIRRVSVARGHTLDDSALVVFGGAGGQHATAIAAKLGVRSLLVHPLAGVLSAWGIGLARPSWHAERDAGRGAIDRAALHGLADALVEEGLRALEAEPGTRTILRAVELRYAGAEHAIVLPLGAELEASFHSEHSRELGYSRPEHPIETVNVRVEVECVAPPVPREGRPLSARAPAPRGLRRMYAGGAWREDVPLYHREDLGAEPLEGPLLVLDATSTLAVDPGFGVRAREDGVLVIEASGSAARIAAETADPVSLEIYANRFMSIAEQMGEVLRRSALSTNIRERLDFSCAVFDADGGLVANAPHIPVHLGAMGETVRGVIERHPAMEDGDVFASNDPALGGSHLPDVTVVTPIFHEGRRRFFAACRGHHADVGGTRPGSMPADSRTLAEEGCVLSALRVVRGGRLDLRALQAALLEVPLPARRFAENLADLEAQIAANRAGAAALLALVEERSAAEVERQMRRVQENAAARVAEAIARLPEGTRRFEDTLDDGARVAVRVDVRGGRLRIDFTGTSAEHEGNLNAPRAVVVAAVIYVLRAMVGAPIPLNQGCLAPVELILPPRSLLDPGPGRAVVAGNVETSQRIVDVLLGALGLAAASQGTMNNLSFGDARFGYYETICGGAGAGPGFPGASAVHTHMTNTRITDLEVLETRFPVRLERFQIRRGSGGAGVFAGGDGVLRELVALAPLELSILSERRLSRPFGLEGGEAGAPGVNRVAGARVGPRVSARLQPGERFSIETPGGGGYGRP